MEYIILRVQRNALGVMEGIVEMDRIDRIRDSVGKCYHRLESFRGSMHKMSQKEDGAAIG